MNDIKRLVTGSTSPVTNCTITNAFAALNALEGVESIESITSLAIGAFLALLPPDAETIASQAQCSQQERLG